MDPWPLLIWIKQRVAWGRLLATFVIFLLLFCWPRVGLRCEVERLIPGCGWPNILLKTISISVYFPPHFTVLSYCNTIYFFTRCLLYLSTFKWHHPFLIHRDVG